MKSFLTSAFFLITAVCFGQNSIPVINILSVETDDVAEELTLNYQLADADGDACEV